MVAFAHQRLTKGRQNLSPLGSRRQRGHQAYSRLVFRNSSLTTGRVKVPAEQRVQQPGPYGVRRLVDTGDSGSGQGNRAVGVTSQIGRLGRVPQHRGTVKAQLLLGIGNLIPQLENGLEMTHRVGEPVRRLRLQPGFHRRRQGLSWVVSPDPVVGKPGRRGDVAGTSKIGALAEDPGKGRMQLGALSRQQVAVQRLLGERVPEGVRLGSGVGDEYLMSNGDA